MITTTIINSTTVKPRTPARLRMVRIPLVRDASLTPYS
jgi:hypothetical protein